MSFLAITNFIPFQTIENYRAALDIEVDISLNDDHNAHRAWNLIHGLIKNDFTDAWKCMVNSS
eukprot:snap_masked-scaffold_2-processed-gene-22.24-mRNA-1 protein AED:1.00 eAED:1.00 QI:0/-1/0/0/-1/1/1/0/62